MNIDVRMISLGHRCHINQIAVKYNIRKMALPFDNIISTFVGVIHCFENNFSEFFPDKDSREVINVGIGRPGADENGNRYLFRNRHFAFPHHDMGDERVRKTYETRIARIDEYLSNTSEPVLFIRTVMDDNEIQNYSRFKNVIRDKYPMLNFIMAFVFDNKDIVEGIWRENDFIVANSKFLTVDENQLTDTIRFKYLFDYITQNNVFDVFHELPCLPEGVLLCNDSFKGWAIKRGIYPYIT